MSDDETPRGRRSHRDSDERGKPAKKKSKGGKSKSKRDRTPECNQPFTSPDDFSNVSIKVQGDKRFYSNDCVLSWNSRVLSEQLNPANTGGSGGGGAKADKGDKKGGGKKGGGSSGGGEKELDWSEKKLGDVIKLLEYIDPRVPCVVTDEDALRIAPLAKEFEMETLLKSCEKQLTQSFFEKRRLRRLNMDIILQNLECADSNKFADLTRMCIDTCVVNSNPYVNRKITESKDISEKTKVEILTRKLERANMRKSKEGSVTSRAGQSRQDSVRD